jgi:hypothetical protein
LLSACKEKLEAPHSKKEGAGLPVFTSKRRKIFWRFVNLRLLTGEEPGAAGSSPQTALRMHRGEQPKSVDTAIAGAISLIGTELMLVARRSRLNLLFAPILEISRNLLHMYRRQAESSMFRPQSVGHSGSTIAVSGTAAVSAFFLKKEAPLAESQRARELWNCSNGNE